MDTSQITGRPVPLGVILLICFLLVATAMAMAMNSLALAGDGSYYLVRILGTEQVFSADARFLGNAVRQAPVLVGARLGVTDTHALSVLLGLGQLVVPAAVWCLALVISRVHVLAFSAVAMAAGLCAGTTWYFSVGENVLAVPLTALVAVVLWRPGEWSWRHVALAVFASLILVASYEAVVLTAPTLAIWAGWRAAVARSSITRCGAVIVSVTAAVSIVTGYAGIVSPRGRSDSQSLLYFVVSLEPLQVYLALASCAALIAVITMKVAGPPRYLLLGGGVVGAAVATYTLTPSTSAAFAARGGTSVAALALELFLFWLWARERRPSRAFSESRSSAEPTASRWLLLAPVLLVAGMAYSNVATIDGWSRSLDTFQAEVERARGQTQVREAVPEERRQVVWGWTSSSLSLIVRRTADADILVDATPSFVPFPPQSARVQLADKYTWRS